MTALEPDFNNRRGRERRVAPRRRTLLEGRLVYGAEGMTLDCTIRDVSQTGAKVKVAGATALPGTVHLIELRRGVAFESEVVWRDYPQLGLRYVKAHRLAEDMSPEHKVLRQVWIEHCGRDAGTRWDEAPLAH